MHREIIQKTLDGKEVARYPSLADAVAVTGFDKSHINYVCLGRRKSHMGFKWEHGESYEALEFKPVGYDIDGNLALEFDSISDYIFFFYPKYTYTTDKIIELTRKLFKKLTVSRNRSKFGFMWRLYRQGETPFKKIPPYIRTSGPGPRTYQKYNKQTKIEMVQDDKVIKVYKSFKEAQKDFPQLTESMVEKETELFGCIFRKVID